jgi:hypothetical protein
MQLAFLFCLCDVNKCIAIIPSDYLGVSLRAGLSLLLR